ncbi:MAG: hypothetical protein N3A01_04450 [Bacteroidales bacterium]|nr:hypothetical protein [Bacteroidales bacterium]
MPIRTFIKSQFGTLLLNRRSKKVHRKKVFNNLEKANTFGIVFNAQEVDSYAAIRSFTNFLQSIGKKYKCLGLISPIEKYDNNPLFSSLIYFSENDFNILGKLVNSSINEFCRTPFHVLLDVRKNKNYFIDYIVVFSLANFKIGTLKYMINYYDLLIDDETSRKDPQVFLQNVSYYLKTIKS